MQQAAAANQAAVAAASAHQGQLQQPADAHRLLMQRQQANVQAQQQFNNIPPGIEQQAVYSTRRCGST